MTDGEADRRAGISQQPGRTAELARRWRLGRTLSPPVQRTLAGRLFGLLWAWLLGSVALGLTFLLVPGLTAESWWAVMLAALVVAVAGWLLRPILDALALPLGWVGVVLIGLFAQAVVMYVALQITPGVHGTSWWHVFAASWVYAAVATLVGFIDQVDEDEVFLAHVVRAALRRNKGVSLQDPDQDGVVIVQMDGVSQPLLRWALITGNLPTLNRWVRTGSHAVDGWTARVPSTTPVSQAGILLGSNEDMPAFRWYEKSADGVGGRLVVANHPPDAALIEERLSNGRGLLADDGWSVATCSPATPSARRSP